MTVLSKHSDHLTQFEKAEIEQYSEIYYFGENIRKINGTTDQDYEDERWDSKLVGIFDFR